MEVNGLEGDQILSQSDGNFAEVYDGRESPDVR
jgi:hypothetical protein